jgi:mono/diheme cytochrome c family protein
LKVNSKYLLWSLLLVLFIAACKHTTDFFIPETKDGPCDPNIVYFENDIKPLLNSSCAYSGCHDANTAADGVILDTYENIIATGDIENRKPPEDSKLYETITETNAGDVMPPPPNSKLTSEQIALIRKWIVQGAKNNGCIDCDSANVTYSSQIVSAMNNNCNACHSSASASGGVILDTYIGVKSQVDNGKLKGTINHDTGFKVMPPSGTKISECNLTIIDKWIADGAPNN